MNSLVLTSKKKKESCQTNHTKICQFVSHCISDVSSDDVLWLECWLLLLQKHDIQSEY